MSTRSTITVKTKEGLKSIYVHWDGYENGTGKTLLKYYNSQELAEKAISLGDLSFLDKSMECPEGHCFNNRIDGYSIAYGRDRGEEGTEAKIIERCEDILFEDYNYFWDGKGWTVSDGKQYREIRI